ncbi:MAG TPA: hypothetical protein VH275_02530 [Solirubrobacterales bacterium]|nr:hypothetical protein [Solirubrobacterales bacterium]
MDGAEIRRRPTLSTTSRALRLWSDRRIRIAVAIVAFAVVTAVTYLVAHPRMFFGFMAYDDEGYMLTALKGFVNHGNLYDDVFTQYGPFYYEVWGGLFSLFGIPLTHDGGRAVTMVAWIVSSLAIGVATMRIAGSLLLGLGTQMLVFSALGVLANEPMHPGGIICLLLAAIIAISCLVRDRVSPLAVAALGGAVAALILVKINVGFFAFASVVLACTVSYPALAERRWLRPLVEAAFVALPVVLLASKFGEGWPRRYAIHVAIAALALVLVLRARRSERRPAKELGWLLGGFLTVAVFSCLVILITGSSPGGLLDGVLRQPLRQSGALTIPLQLDKRLYSLDLIALGGAVAYWYVSRYRKGEAGTAWLAMTSVFSIGVGLVMALSVAGKGLPFDAGTLAGYQFSMLGFCWVALIAPPVVRRANVSFPLLLLPLLAVPQALHAFPVAGSQTLWATFLLIPVGAICVANGVRGLVAALPDGAERRALLGVAAAGVVVFGYLVINSSLREPLRANRDAYDGAVSLDLPGTGPIRLGQPEVQLYRQITHAIDRNCSSLIMFPGMDSFYLWTEQEPPTGYTATGWPTLFDDAHQRHVIADIAPIKGLCQLRNIPIAAGWGNGVIPPGPLVRYLEHGFAPVASFGAYELLKRAGGGASS